MYGWVPLLFIWDYHNIVNFSYTPKQNKKFAFWETNKQNVILFILLVIEIKITICILKDKTKRNGLAKCGVLSKFMDPRLFIDMLVHLSCSVMPDCDHMDCSPPGSSVHGIFQARILEWVAIPFSRGSSSPRDWTPVSALQAYFLLSVPQGSPVHTKLPAVLQNDSEVFLYVYAFSLDLLALWIS